MSEQKQYDNTNRWAVWKNEVPKQDDRDPDYSGTLNVNGVEYFIDGWLGETNKGKKMMNGRIKPKKQQGGGSPVRRNQGPDDSSDF